MEQILILEDDENFRELVADLLEAEGYEVTAVGSAQEAIEVAQRNDFHLLLTDVRMAGGTDGVGALESIKRRTEHIRSIVMTGFADQEVPIRAARLQADDYLTKPFDLHELTRSVRAVLDREDVEPGLIGKLLASPGSFWERSRRWLHDKELRQLRELRARFYQRLFLLIRSGRMSSEEAYPVFNRLVPLEGDILRDEPGLWASLTQAFQELEGLLLSSLSGQPLQATQSIPRPHFQRFYARVGAGSIAAEHFLRAIPLWLSPEARKSDLDSYTCYCRLWEEDVSHEDSDPFIGLTLDGVCLARRLVGVSQARLYETTENQGRVLCLPDTPENQGFLAAELASSGVHQLGTFQEHCLLFYPKPVGSMLKGRLRPGGLAPEGAWAVIEPVFLEVEKQNSQELYCGCFGQRHISFHENGAVQVDGFGPERWQSLTRSAGNQPGDLFWAAPEFVDQPTPGPRSDQFVLARLFGEAVVGMIKPVDSFTLFVADSPSPAKERLRQRCGAVWPVIEKMSRLDPEERFCTLAQAREALQACMEPWVGTSLENGQDCQKTV